MTDPFLPSSSQISTGVDPITLDHEKHPALSPTAQVRLLSEELHTRMAAEGPLSVAQYMATALTHPRYGYYVTRNPLGSGGDFITAPDISQTFGEMLGLWLGVMWQSLGSPASIKLVELGPGRGTMMKDMLRAAQRVPGFLDAIELCLIESNLLLRGIQADRLEAFAPMIYPNVSDLPEDGPALFIANEFLDALPIRQFERHTDGQGRLHWFERLIGPAQDTDGMVIPGQYRFVRSPYGDAAQALIPEAVRAAPREGVPEGSVYEVCPQALSLARTLAEHIASQGGAALMIDYGYEGGKPGHFPPLGSLQALHRHHRADPLLWPGLSDLTAHVDFAAFAQAATEGDLATRVHAHGAVEQGVFLKALGIQHRVDSLCQGKDEQQQHKIRSAVNRLTAPDAMGTLFKAIALTPVGLAPPGFPEPL